MAQPRLRVLVPLDGTPESETVLPALMPLFKTRKTRLTLLAVAPRASAAAAMELYLGRLKMSLLLDGIHSEGRVQWGDPAAEILRAASPVKFDLIAMTTHGRTGLRRELVGSVAGTVLRFSNVPILAFRPGEKVGDWNRMVVALDGSATAESVLDDAAALAGALGSTLHLVRVRSAKPRLTIHPEDAFPVPEEEPQPYLEGMADGLATKGLLALADVRQGDPADEIVALARETDAGLICLTTHARIGLSRELLGSVAESVLRAAPCPVLLRRAAAVREPQPASGVG